MAPVCLIFGLARSVGLLSVGGKRVIIHPLRAIKDRQNIALNTDLCG